MEFHIYSMKEGKVENVTSHKQGLMTGSNVLLHTKNVFGVFKKGKYMAIVKVLRDKKHYKE
jgi:hypothetical protein